MIRIPKPRARLATARPVSARMPGPGVLASATGHRAATEAVAASVAEAEDVATAAQVGGADVAEAEAEAEADVVSVVAEAEGAVVDAEEEARHRRTDRGLPSVQDLSGDRRSGFG